MRSLGFLAVLGIGATALATPHHITIASIKRHAKAACVFPDGTSPEDQAEIHCYNPSQFIKAYGIDQVHAQGLTGKGQTIIFADSFGSPTLQSDLDTFSDTFNLPRTTIEFVYPNGQYVNKLADEDHVGWAQETTLDLEWAHAIAPDAKLVNIVTSSSESTGLTGLPDLFAGIKMAVQKYPHAIISMSFGTGEGTFKTDEIKTYLQGSFHQIFADAIAADYTLLSSAGDSGSAELDTAGTAIQDKPDASYPASDPLVTAVGGTNIQADWKWTPEGSVEDYWACQLSKNAHCQTDFLKFAPALGSIIETVWKEDWTVAAGGGGISTVFSAPDFQANLGDSVQKLANGFRTIPDVSLNASINGGVQVYMGFGANNSRKPTWQNFGGTSCASPETAALVALAGQGASDALNQSVGIGSLNPILYQLPGDDFNDIVPQTFGDHSQVVIDNNALYFNKDLLAALGPKSVPPVAVPGYQVTEGYDIATGLGSPKAVNFVNDLVKARVARATKN